VGAFSGPPFHLAVAPCHLGVSGDFLDGRSLAHLPPGPMAVGRDGLGMPYLFCMSGVGCIMGLLTKCGLEPSGWPPANRPCDGGPGGRAAAGRSRGRQRKG